MPYLLTLELILWIVNCVIIITINVTYYLFILKKTLMSDYGLNISDMYERQHVDHVLCEIKFGIYLKLFNVLNFPIGWPA